jgi:RNA-directed DNA polymerase
MVLPDAAPSPRSLIRLRKATPFQEPAEQPTRKAGAHPEGGKPGEWRMLGIPTIFDRVCQQALLNRLMAISQSAA